MSSPQIPKQHKACVYDNPGTLSVKVQQVDTPAPGPGEVLVNLTHSGVCHSDFGIMMNSWRGLPYPTQPGQVGGHEGVGSIVALGPGAERYNLSVGQRVGIKWLSEICNNCGPCLEGMDGVCSNAKISGYYTPGTYQQYVVGPADYVTPIPDALSSEDAAPMLCAGVTTYAALRKSNARAGQWVVISGAGGGLGHIACQLAKNGFGYRVIGVDAGEKKDLAMRSGCDHFLNIFDYKEDAAIGDAVKQLTGGNGAKAVIVCTANNRAYAQGMLMLSFGGHLVCVGMPEGDSVPIANSHPQYLVGHGLTITSTAVGNRQEAIETLEWAARGVVHTSFVTKKMEDLQDVFKEMEQGKLQGRVVLDLS